jgi:hypothetical protein
MVVVLEGARGLKGVQFPIPEKPNGTPLPFCLQLTTFTPQFH